MGKLNKSARQRLRWQSGKHRHKRRPSSISSPERKTSGREGESSIHQDVQGLRYDARSEHATNVEVSRRTGINNIVDEVKKRRWSWLGHALHMNKTRTRTLH
ncbi:hypothetical protein BaRGS_00032483 [Batillaria attramentaria]|uniref:Uncharacterized protein n=1 Tax=Batillaria attramentaria TaxID=370345 RepID=A0ABD0JNN4_9CAEN